MPAFDRLVRRLNERPLHTTNESHQLAGIDRRFGEYVVDLFVGEIG
jgi:hypothetical protein